MAPKTGIKTITTSQISLVMLSVKLLLSKSIKAPSHKASGTAKMIKRKKELISPIISKVVSGMGVWVLNLFIDWAKLC